MTQSINFTKMGNDAAEPSAVIARRKSTGDVEFTVVAGGDEEIDRGLVGIKIMIYYIGSLSDALELIKNTAVSDANFDITPLIDMYQAGDDWKAEIDAAKGQ